MKRKVCVVTGSRADYGLLRWVMEGIREAPRLELQVLATGSHLSPEFGLTIDEVINDGFRVDRRVEMLLSADTSTAIAKSMGLGMIGYADAFADLRPDLLVVLGDRFEAFSAAAAALVARIPIAHIHGGETTEGAVDEAFRHSISKMAYLHFVAAEEYRKRVIQLGEDPRRVFLVGGLGIDIINKLPLLTRMELENALGVTFGKKNLLCTFHPVTLEESTAREQMGELLAALDLLEDTVIFFTAPNADTDGRIVRQLIERYLESHSDSYLFTSLGQLRYLSLVKYVDGVVGNSSSGLTEVPTLLKGTINIGDRQRGRLKAKSVIDCAPKRQEILAAVRRLYQPTFASVLASSSNPYGGGGAARNIVEIIERSSAELEIKKQFFDLAN